MGDNNHRMGETGGNMHNNTTPENVLSLHDILRLLFAIMLLVPKMILSFIKYHIRKPKSLQGKVCLVTGAGRGLGRELSLQLSKLGAEVICVDIREETNSETVKLIKESGGKAHGYICNVAKYQDVADLAETVQKEVGRVYMLVNNAGLIMIHNAGEWPPEDVIAMYNVNVLSHYWMIQAFLPAMKEVNEGHIVGIASLSAQIAVPRFSVYGSTKAALDAMLKILRIELNRSENNKIVVTSVLPSIINTSDDITAMYPSGNLKMLRTEEVVRKIIEEVRLDNTHIVIPKFLKYIVSFLVLLPESAIMTVFEILHSNVTIPSKEDKNNLMFGKINKKCL